MFHFISIHKCAYTHTHTHTHICDRYIYQVKGTAVNGPLVVWWRCVALEKHAIVLRLGLSPLMSLCLWTVNFPSISQVLILPPQVGHDGQSGPELDISLHQVRQTLTTPYHVRLWFSTFP